MTPAAIQSLRDRGADAARRGAVIFYYRKPDGGFGVVDIRAPGHFRSAELDSFGTEAELEAYLEGHQNWRPPCRATETTRP